MNREMIIRELQNRGYDAEGITNIKNGVSFDGIRIMTNTNIAPVIYTDKLLKCAHEENKSLNDVVSAVIDIYEKHGSVDFDVKEFCDHDFILNHLYVGLQRESTEKLIKRACDFDGIESYLYIRRDKSNGDSYSVKLNEGILKKAQITEEEAWKSAECNTNAETVIQSMATAICELMNMDYSEEMEEMIPLYIISNKSKQKGASAILNREAISEFGERHNTNKIMVLPSSIHEMILLPYTEELDLQHMSDMVKEVNQNEVSPEERLTDRAYIITL